MTVERRKRRPSAVNLIVRGILAAVLLSALGFAVDFMLGYDKTARGVEVAGVDLGSKTDAQARAALAQIAKTAGSTPIVIHTDSGEESFTPTELGATFDAEATLSRLKEQPANPLTRLTAIFGTQRTVNPVVDIDRTAFDAALDKRKRTLEKAAVEGGVHFSGLTPVADYPATGMRIDRDAAVRSVQVEWLNHRPINLAMEPFSPTVDKATVDKVRTGIARDVTASPVRLKGRGTDIVVSPRELGRLVRFTADGKGGLAPQVDPTVAKKELEDRTAATESKAQNASFQLSGGSPTVIASTDGAKVNWRDLAGTIATTATAERRTVDLPYTITKPELTTAKAKKLGVKEVVAEFTTGGFSGPSGENIRLVAQQVDGALVLPGKTFSLNGYTGPRGSAQGYVESGIIDHGRPAKAVGGGISQFATTLYNAAYFAGLEDAGHTEHAYYISRYPEAREATVFEGLIDLQFRNNTRNGIFIETAWSPSSITVRMWSTKVFDVESITGPRTDQTSPETVDVPAGDDCIPSSGAIGFTASNTRIVRDHRSGAEISRNDRTVRYAPEPIVRCR